MHNGRSLFVLFLVMFFVMVGFGIIIPVLPFYAESFGATSTQLGLLMAVYSLMQFIFSPFWGRVSESIGRKPVILIGITGLALSFFMMAYANSLFMLFVARIVGGILSAANMPTVNAYVADITTPENRSKGMGMIGAAIGLGFILGPAIGGIFSDQSLSLPFVLAGISSIVTLLLVIFILKESLPAERRRAFKKNASTSRWIAFEGTNKILFFLQFFISLSMAGLEATFAYFAAEKAGLTSKDIGYIFMIMGLAGAFVQGGLIGPLAKKFGEGRIIQGGIILSTIGFLLILLLFDFTTAAIYITIFGIGNGVIRPTITALLTKNAKGGYGTVTGLLSSFDSLGRIIGPPLGGWLFYIGINFPFISGAILSIVALLLFQIYQSKGYQSHHSA